MWYKNAGTSFFRFVTNHTFDRQTDGQHSDDYTVRCVICSRTVIKRRITVDIPSDLHEARLYLMLCICAYILKYNSPVFVPFCNSDFDSKYF